MNSGWNFGNFIFRVELDPTLLKNPGGAIAVEANAHLLQNSQAHFMYSMLFFFRQDLGLKTHFSSWWITLQVITKL